MGIKLRPFEERYIKKTDIEGYSFLCPGCRSHHVIYTKNHPQINWGFNGSLDKPTFTPSIKVWNPRREPPYCCHSFIKDGNIQFLNDCTHELKGQTVELPDIEDSK